MDSGVVHSPVHDEYGQDHHPQNVGLQQQGGDEHHHDIKSVLKKAKAKAKKIKNTITKNRHGHDQGQHVPDDDGSYDDDDKDEGTVENPEDHGSPIYESAAIENLGHPGVDVGGTTVTGVEDRQEARTVDVSSRAESNLNSGTEPAGTFIGEDKTRQSAEVNLDRPLGLDEHYHQSKITDPTGAGAEELNTTPVEETLARMNIDNEPKQNTVLPIDSGTQYPSAGSRGQFSPEPTPTPTNSFKFPEYPQETGKISESVIKTEEHPGCETTEKPEFPQETAKTFDAMAQPEELPHHKTIEKPSTHISYTEKVPSATSEIAEEAVSAENIVASKLGYGEKDDGDDNEMKHYKIDEEKPSNQGSYTEKISSATSAIADKAISAKDIVASKLGYGEKDERENKEDEMKHEERNNGEEKPSNQGSYTEKISSATSAVADRTISAKDVVTSKLGFGEKGERDNKETTHVENESEDAAAKPKSTPEYGKKIASTMREKLAPVYGAVMSKMPGAGTGTGAGTETHASYGQDKGVSVKDYLAEKLRPGDEDRALSEVISEAYHKGKKDPMEDAGHENRAKAEPDRPLGMVTESEEVKRYLGIDKDEKGSEDSHVNSPGKGVVDKLKGAVGSWFGKTQEPPSTQVTEERRLPDSSN